MEKGRTINVVGAVVVFFILLFVYTKFAGPIPFSVNSTNTNSSDTFQVSGVGKAAAAPDSAKVTIGVIKTSLTLSDTQSKTNQAADQVISAIKKLGVPEKNIKTINYSVNPNYDNEGQKITGYTVNQTLEVKSDIDKINQVIDAGTANGANVTSGVEFILNDDKRTELENQARKEAVEKAKKKAEGLAKAAGIKLGRITNVTESSGTEPRPVFLETKANQPIPETQTNITPGENNISVTVTLSYQTL